MQKQALHIALLSLFCLPALHAQILFEKCYGDNLDNVDYVGGSMLAPDGGVVLGGYTERDKNYDAFVQKFNADGTEAWYNLYGGPGMELVSSGTPAAGGGYLFAGATLNPADGSLDALLFKVDENGDLLWWKTYGADATDVGLAVCQLDNGHIALLGASTLPNGQSAHFRTEYDANGAFKSAVFYPMTGAITNILAIATPDGGYVAVLAFGDFLSSSSTIIKYNAALMPQWSRTSASLSAFTGGASVEGLFDVKATDTGVLVCAKTWAGSHLFHLSYPTGTVLWSRRTYFSSSSNAGLHVWPDGTISVVSHAFYLSVKTISADGTTLDSIANPLSISSYGKSTFLFRDSATLCRVLKHEYSTEGGYSIAYLEQIQAPVLAWQHTTQKNAPPEVESSKASASMPDGGFVILGTKEDSAGTNQVWLLRADPQGAVLWSRLFDVRANRPFFQPGSLKIDAAGNSIVLAVTYGYDFINDNNIAEYRLLKISPNGDLLFIKTIATSSYDADFFGAVPLPDGGYIACVTYDEGNNATTPHLVRMDANANVLWTKAYSGRLVNDVIALPNGNLVGAGIKGSTPWMFATDADGNLLWEHNYSVGASGLLHALAVASDGHLIATGYSLNAAGTSAQLLALKADGSTGVKLWHNQFSKAGIGLWLGDKVLAGPAGGAVVVGTFLMPPVNVANYYYSLFRYRVSVTAMDAAGNMISDQFFGNDGTYPTAPSADRTPDGKVLLCATVNVGSSLADAWVAKIDINTATATHQPRFEGDLALSPNPAAGQTRISFTAPHNGPVLVRMFDANGREVLRTTGDKQTETWATQLVLDGLATGLYRVQVVMREGQVTQSVAVSGK